MMGDADDPWFALPPKFQVRLSGFEIEKGVSIMTNRRQAAESSVPAVPAPQVAPPISESPKNVPQHPSSAAASASVENQRQQLSTQQQALRMLQSQASRNNAPTVNPPGDGRMPPMDPAVLQKMMAAARNGQIDLNNPALQQFKFFMLAQHQQQQRQQQMLQQSNAAASGAGAGNPTAMLNNGQQPNQGGNPPSNAQQKTPQHQAQPQTSVPNVDQMIQQAVQQQQIVQQQPGYGQGHNGSGLGNAASQQPAQQMQSQLQPQAPTPQQQNAAAQQHLQQQRQASQSQVQPPAQAQPELPKLTCLWTGNLVWRPLNSTNTGCECFSLARLCICKDCG